MKRDRSSEFAPERGRYHLYVSLACPWAHRTIILRKLKGLEETIGMTVVDLVRDERGWASGTAMVFLKTRSTGSIFSARHTCDGSGF